MNEHPFDIAAFYLVRVRYEVMMSVSYELAWEKETFKQKPMDQEYGLVG